MLYSPKITIRKKQHLRRRKMVIRCFQVLQNLVADGVTAHIQISCIVVHQDVVWHSVEWVDLKNTTVYNHITVQTLCALCLSTGCCLENAHRW